MAQFLSGRNLAGLSVEIHSGSQRVRSVRLVWHYPDPCALVEFVGSLSLRSDEKLGRTRNTPRTAAAGEGAPCCSTWREQRSPWRKQMLKLCGKKHAVAAIIFSRLLFPRFPKRTFGPFVVVPCRSHKWSLQQLYRGGGYEDSVSRHVLSLK